MRQEVVRRLVSMFVDCLLLLLLHVRRAGRMSGIFPIGNCMIQTMGVLSWGRK